MTTPDNQSSDNEFLDDGAGSGPLQDFSHENSQYQRPQQSVVYTTLADAKNEVAGGEVCYEKPAGKGPDRQPFVKHYSLRKRRSMFTFAMTAMTIGCLLIAFQSPYSKEFIAPGPLSSPHGQILGSLGNDRCAACHQEADGSFSQWSLALVGLKPHPAAGGEAVATQSQLCMKCHEKSFAIDVALNPHNLLPEQMDALTAHAAKTKTVSFPATEIGKEIGDRLGIGHGSQIACNACHREHHGNVSLSQLTDQQCQSCHQQTFHSFETGHPEFTKWPLVKRQGIAFDHNTHLSKHFPEKQLEFSCNQCHVTDVMGNVQQTAPFEQSCGACHAQAMAQSGERGWTLFELPMIDMDAIEQAGASVGNWPLAATGDFDGEIPPMMKLLLSGDKKIASVLKRLESDFSFGDIDPDSRDEVADAVEIVWGIKRLLGELASDGGDAIAQRIEAATGRVLSGSEVEEILAGLDEGIFKATVKRWLPDLNAELEEVTSLGTPESILNRLKQRSASVSLTKPKFLATVSTQRELAENPLAGRAPATAPSADAPESSEDETDDNIAQQSAVVQPSQAFVPPANSELLMANPLRSSIAGTSDEGNGGGANPDPAGQRSDSKTPPVAVAPKVVLPTELSIPRASAELSFEPGWYRSDTRFRVGYRPAEHADRLVKAWSDLVASFENADTSVATQRLFAALTSVTAPGNCRSCHNVDQAGDDTFAFRWGGALREATDRPFTKFSHRPHLTLPQLRDCKHCHQMDQSKTLAGVFDEFDPHNAVSNFLPVTKADCSACHQSGRTESGCMQCHNYHVDHKKVSVEK